MVEVFTEDRAIEGSNHPAEEQEVVLKSRFISLLPPMVTGQIALLSLTGRSKVIDESGDEIAVTREELKNKVGQFLQTENIKGGINMITKEDYQKSSVQLNHTPEEVKRVIGMLQ